MLIDPNDSGYDYDPSEDNDTNISLLSSVVVDSYSSQDSSFPWSNLLDGNTNTNSRSASGNPSNQWIIIDLGTTYSLTGFTVYNATFADDTTYTEYFRIAVSATGTDEGDFTEVVASTCIFQRGLWGIGAGFITRSISATDARYVKLYLDDNWGHSSYIALSDFEIYSEDAITTTETVTSDAVILATSPTTTILSDASIMIPPVYHERLDITSNAAITLDKLDRLSDAYVVNAVITSNAHIQAEESVSIPSSAYVYRSGAFVKTGLLYGRAALISGSRGVLIYSADISSSDETIVADTVTGPIMDMETVSPPLGYSNYDWKYDWVVRTFNKCQYKFEARSADNLLDLSAESFHEIALGDQIYKGQIKRYHQWLCHIWASGSGDFELHQFTIKGYVDNPVNPFYRALREGPFITTSHVTAPGDAWTTQIYEPPLDVMYWRGPYVPGDMDADNDIDQDDANLLLAVQFYGYPQSSILSPGIVRGAWDHTNTPSVADIMAAFTYLSSAGPPPSRQDEPS